MARLTVAHHYILYRREWQLPFFRVFYVLLDLVERLVADVMLDTAGIGCSGLLVDAEHDQSFGQDTVALVDALGDLLAVIGQQDLAFLADGNEAFILQDAHGTADTRLGKVHLACDVDRADAAISLLQDQDRLEIILAGFINTIHGRSPYHFSFKLIITLMIYIWGKQIYNVGEIQKKDMSN